MRRKRLRLFRPSASHQACSNGGCAFKPLPSPVFVKFEAEQLSRIAFGLGKKRATDRFYGGKILVPAGIADKRIAIAIRFDAKAGKLFRFELIFFTQGNDGKRLLSEFAQAISFERPRVSLSPFPFAKRTFLLSMICLDAPPSRSQT